MEPDLCQISLMVHISWADGECSNLHSPNVVRNDWTDEQIVAFLKSEMEGHIAILQAKLAQRSKRIKDNPPPLSSMEKSIAALMNEVEVVPLAYPAMHPKKPKKG